MNELFLISITLLTVFIHGNDRAPALTYCLAAHVLNLIKFMTDNVAAVYLAGGVGDAVLLALLVCLNGCLRSRITYFLIPLSIISIGMHFWGWALYMNGADADLFNSIVVFYMCVIIALFLSRAIRYGDSFRDTRFLRRDEVRDKNMGVVSE